MIITHKIDQFLYMIFPELKDGGEELIKTVLTNYYTYNAFKPSVSIENGWVTIKIDVPKIISQEEDYKKMISFCEKEQYSDAKPLLEKLIKANPTNSDYHRIKGQIMSDEGDQEEAINCLIDALKWDSKNGWALLMMGNIFAKYKNDIDTAMKYYDQAIISNPNDNIAVNNIGANLLNEGKLNEAKKYFWKANEINSNYPNTHHALGLISETENDLHSAFYSFIKAIKLNSKRDALFQNSVSKAFDVAKKICQSGDAKGVVKNYMHKLEFDGGKEIESVIDNTIPVAAKIEFAEFYNREKHLIKYKSDYPAVDHLIMHELMHLEFVIDARKNGLNQMFVSTQSHKLNFIKSISSFMKKLQGLGLSSEAIEQYSSSLFDGLNLQVYNAPIDMFIEDKINTDYSELRPYQFLSLYSLIQQGLKAVTDKKIIELSPTDILSSSKIYNLVSALQFKDLFGLDFIKDYGASTTEMKLANSFYNEFLEYKDDKEPAEEYELVLHWAEDLKLDKNFELVSEDEYSTKRTNIDSLLASIENDPLELNSIDPYKEREMKKFQKSQSDDGTNMAVVMFMVDALKFFETMNKDEIKKIAFEIAMLGTQGIRPDKKDYRITSIKGKTFSGFHLLAYYYVSWILAIPDMLSQLQLPYDNEYKLALTIHNPK